MDRLISTQEVAERLNVDKKTVLRYIHAGKLKGSRIGRDYRIAESTVKDFLSRSELFAPRPRGATIVTAMGNQKGGVGKTTSTFNLGAALHRLGRRALLIELDPQAALS